jgi:hypothetical protein
MMGRQEVQEALFYRFRIEDHVPAEHLLRRIDWLLDFSAIRHEFEALYSHTGRPSVDPELMIRMLLIGYLYGIRSERRLVEEVHLNLAYRWFCRLGLEGRVPDRSTFSKNGYSEAVARRRRIFQGRARHTLAHPTALQPTLEFRVQQPLLGHHGQTQQRLAHAHWLARLGAAAFVRDRFVQPCVHCECRRSSQAARCCHVRW